MIKSYRVTVNGNAYDVTVEELDSTTQSAPAPAAPAAQAPAAPAAPAPSRAASGAQGTINIDSPLPGAIYKVNVKPGEKVAKGQVLLIIEAMKMENEITSPAAGTVATINANEGATVNVGDLLMTLK